MRILIVTDAWSPQVNGVVRTLETVRNELDEMGHDVHVISPDQFTTIPCPTYPEIRLALFAKRKLARMIDALQPVAIHISTEGPLGQAARKYCLKRDLPFSTAYHTRFPEYLYARTKLPLSISYRGMRRFHGKSQSVMVATETLRDELGERGFNNLHIWSRGVDLDLFRPRPDASFGDFPKPHWLFVGRVAVEKNIGHFLDLDLPGTKFVVGDGPQLADLRSKYPNAQFLGKKIGEDLAIAFASADVFVFPSKTDTFGLVILEALASGTPVAVFPVQGPADIVRGTKAGAIDADLREAALAALELDSKDARALAEQYSWRNSAAQFLHNLAPFSGGFDGIAVKRMAVDTVVAPHNAPEPALSLSIKQPAE
ncbi:glycosyltransferase family 4 protein [Thalassospira alkalitolerans]|uniref:GDP-mannose-dependent alpha-mannosyltransferase n=1 Tax=Thalassospira alkalitolerans TaxID=1293890 RepID=A0A1Y2L6U2_9PROT|nr:glycosyltransferase family 1 protein [Thalassospira alkalitolerans]OSQ44307.1 GDP-mannose-dependent alpha-mannosyltransferase [Thalassospira alkalitolerans]|tara:strand:- start:55162 stop:56271 length:1110 start_codon:yes stop_codon:yes gene_type:complete